MNSLNRDKIVGLKLVRLRETEKKYNIGSQLYAAIGHGETGSIKDRVALYMIEAALRDKKIKQGGTFIEATSGNTGIGIAYIARETGFKSLIVMPSSMSVERIELMRKYGAEVKLSDAKLGMKGASKLAEEFNSEIENSVILGQFDNMANVKAHYETTAPKIFQEIAADCIIAGIGTGGTITGIGKYIKDNNLKTKVIGFEPLSSPLLSKGVAGPHKIQGIGANFIPSIFDRNVVNEITSCSDEDAYKFTKELYSLENIYAGISSGAAYSVMIKQALVAQNTLKKLVCILPDGGEKYVSTGVFE